MLRFRNIVCMYICLYLNVCALAEWVCVCMYSSVQLSVYVHLCSHVHVSVCDTEDQTQGLTHVNSIVYMSYSHVHDPISV